MGIITLALATYHGWSGSNFEVPLWVVLAAATAMGLGTALGGWRIIRTMGLKVVELRSIDGFAAETAAASIINSPAGLAFPFDNPCYFLRYSGASGRPEGLRQSVGVSPVAHRHCLGGHHSGMHYVWLADLFRNDLFV